MPFHARDPADPHNLLDEIRKARRSLPVAHRALLDQLNVQETAIVDWPGGVIDLYRTLRERSPSRAQLEKAAAVWLHEQRTAAFNAPLLEVAMSGLDTTSRRRLVESIAWHEYGHALSFMRSTAELRIDGARLLELLPDGLRYAVGSADYRASQIFDEIVATLYAVMIDRIRQHGYGPPKFLHPDLFAAFQEVIPWPPTR
jgi:hypothetical protein